MRRLLYTLCFLCAAGASMPQPALMKSTRHFSFHSIPSAEAYVEEIAPGLEAAYKYVSRVIGYRGSEKIEVHIYESLQAELKLDAWSNGFAGKGRIELSNPINPYFSYGYMKKVPLHELVHVLYHRTSGGAVDRWFSEGLAECLSGGPRTREERLEAVKAARARGELGTLRDLALVFTKKGLGYETLGYSASSLFVEYLRDRYGDRALRKIIRRGARNVSLRDKGMDRLYEEYYALGL